MASSGAGWSLRGPAVALGASPTMLWNNLTTNGVRLAFAHRDEVHTIAEAATDGKEAADADKISFKDPAMVITQVRWCLSDTAAPVLVVTHTGGIILVDSTAKRILGVLHVGVVVDSPDAGAYARGIAGNSTHGNLFVGGSSGNVAILKQKGESYAPSGRLTGLSGACTCVDASARYTAAGADSGGIIVFAAASGAREAAFAGTGYPVTGLVLRDDIIVAAYASGHIRLLRASAGVVVVEVAGHARCINALDMHPTQFLWATAGDDGQLNIWSAPDYDKDRSCRVALVSSSAVMDSFITGVAFPRGGGSMRVSAVAYDVDYIRTWRP